MRSKDHDGVVHRESRSRFSRAVRKSESACQPSSTPQDGLHAQHDQHIVANMARMGRSTVSGKGVLHPAEKPTTYRAGMGQGGRRPPPARRLAG